jgi:ubiquinone/menaquinone biosynthesis C-methylase UbiE
MKGQPITPDTNPASTEIVKQCCAKLYESDLAKILLGDFFHPGGLRLTERLGSLLHLTAESHVLDVASGKGASAFFLAEQFGCHVVGVDYGNQNVAKANDLADTKGLSSRVRFERGDAERLPFPEACFDAVLCECAFCTFPNKIAAAREFARVLRPGGRVGLSDLTRGPALPKELDTLLAWITCIADAQPVDSYAEYLRSAAFELEKVELHDEVLIEMVHQIRIRLLGAEVLTGLKKIALSGVDFVSAKQMAQSALTAIRHGQLGYAVLIAVEGGRID